MSFEGALLFSNVIFLSGYLGVKLWDVLSGRDHLWEYAFAAARRRAGLPKLEVARPALGSTGELISQAKALNIEGAWLILTFASAWMWQPSGARGAEMASLVDAHEVLVQRQDYAYALIMLVIRYFWWRKFAKS